MSDDSRDQEIERLDELPRRVSTQRASEVSKKYSDWEVTLFEDVEVLNRHLKPLFRFLLRQVGREWIAAAPEVETRCRNAHAPRKVKARLFAIICKQVGLAVDGAYSLLFPRPVYVDRDTGKICRMDE